MSETLQIRPTTLHGLDALAMALREPSKQLFRRSWNGELKPIGLQDAARAASRDAHSALVLEIDS